MWFSFHFILQAFGRKEVSDIQEILIYFLGHFRVLIRLSVLSLPACGVGLLSPPWHLMYSSTDTLHSAHPPSPSPLLSSLLHCVFGMLNFLLCHLFVFLPGEVFFFVALLSASWGWPPFIPAFLKVSVSGIKMCRSQDNPGWTGNLHQSCCERMLGSGAPRGLSLSLSLRTSPQYY